MRAVDTNVLVRALTQDEPAQAARAAACLRGGPIFIADTVLLETEWVLRDGKGIPRDRLIPVLRQLVSMPNVHVRDRSMIDEAFRLAESGLELADALHLAGTPPGASFVTFDQRLRRRAQRAGVAVEEP